MGKVDAEDRRRAGEPIPEEVQRLLNQLVAGAVVWSEVLDIHGPRGVPGPSADRAVLIMRRDLRTDWMVREDVKAKVRSSVKRLLVRYDYPPDRQQDAVKLVMEQMEALTLRLAA